MEANEKINNLIDESILLKIIKTEKNNIGLVGLGFKPNTSVVTEGLALKIINLRGKRNYNIFVYDELNDSYENLNKETDANFNRSDSLEQLIDQSDVIVLCNNNEKYNINYSNKVIIDPWRLIRI